jgi:hypothetical protein
VRRKVLQDIVNTLPAMLVGWRMGDDLDVLAELPDGTLELDLVAESARHSSGVTPHLHVVAELAAWLRRRLVEEGIPIEAVLKASVTVAIRTNRIRSDRKSIVSFDFSCRSTVATSTTTYAGTLEERHSWHRRVGKQSSATCPPAS